MADTQQHHTTTTATHHTQQQEVDTLKQQIDLTASKAKDYLDTLKTNVHEYDTTHPSADKASDALQAGIHNAQTSVDELTHIGTKLSSHETSHKTSSHQSLESAYAALEKVKTSLNALQTSARAYDAKLATSSATGSVTGGAAAGTVETIANKTRQVTNDALEVASVQLARMRNSETGRSVQNAAGTAGRSVQVAAGEALLIGNKIDAKLGVTTAASGAASAISNTATNLDRRMQVTETAAKLDQQYAGGVGATIVHKGVELVQTSVEYVTEAMQNAKIAASQSSSAQAADKQATSAIDATHAAALNARDSAMNAVGMNSNKPVTDEVAHKTAATAESVKHSAQQTAATAQQKGHELAGSAQQTGHEVKHAAHDATTTTGSSNTSHAHSSSSTTSHSHTTGVPTTQKIEVEVKNPATSY